MAEQVSPLAGKSIDPSRLVNVPRLVTAYFTGRPDPAIPVPPHRPRPEPASEPIPAAWSRPGIGARCGI